MLTKNKSAISHVVALLVPGITLETLGLLPRKDTPNMPKAVKPKEGEPVASTSRLPVLEKLFAHYCPTRAPGDKYRMHSALQTFTSVPLTAQQKAKRDKEAKEGACAHLVVLLPHPFLTRTHSSDTTSRGGRLPSLPGSHVRSLLSATVLPNRRSTLRDRSAGTLLTLAKSRRTDRTATKCRERGTSEAVWRRL